MHTPPFRAEILLLTLFLACTSVGKVPEQPRQEPTQGGFVVSGVMNFLPIETGCWFLETAAGQRYELAGEDLEILQIEGLVVEVEVRFLKGAGSTCQVGTIVEVLNIYRMER